MRAAAAVPVLLLAACGGGGEYDPGYHSGEKVAARWFEAAGGARHFDTWIDRDSGTPCRWVQNTDNLQRCLVDSVVMYTDAGCLTPVWIDAPPYGWLDDGTAFAAFELGAASTIDRGALFIGGPGACVAAGGSGTLDVQPAGAALPATRFATATVEVGDRGTLRAQTRVADDGSSELLATPVDDTGMPCELVTDGCMVGDVVHPLTRSLLGGPRLRWVVLDDPSGDWRSPPIAIHDDSLQLDCGFVEIDGAWVCQPGAIGLRMDVFATVDCSDPATAAILLPGGTPPPTVAASCVGDGCDDVQVHFLGPALSQEYTMHPLAGCIAIAQLASDPYEQGDPIGVEFAPAELVVDP
jgi:hypothetical protein